MLGVFSISKRSFVVSRTSSSNDVIGRLDFRDFASLLRQCSSLKALKQLHERISAAGYDKNTFLGNHLVQMYGKCKSVGEARSSFDRIRERNLISWNILLAAYFQNGDLQSSSDLFRRMPRRDVFSWNSMIAAHAQNRDLIAANDLFEEMAEKDAVSWNTIIAAYAAQGLMLQAQKLFDEMPDRSHVSWNAMISGYAQNEEIAKAEIIFDRLPLFNLLTWNLMIAGYSQNGQGKEAIGMLAALDHQGIQPDVFTLSSSFDACGIISDLRLGQQLHGEMPRDGSNTVAATALVTMYGRCRDAGAAKAVFDAMRDRNVVSWNAMVTALAENDRLQEAEEIFRKLPLKDLASWNVMLAGYARHGSVDDAKRIFNDIPERDVVSWNAMISAYSENNNSSSSSNNNIPLSFQEFDLLKPPQVDHHPASAQAFALFRSMDLEGCQPNKVTFVASLAACNGNAALHQGKLLHKLIAQRGLDDDVAVGAVLVLMYGKCGSVSDSETTFERMKKKNSPAVAWNSMVAAYARNGHTLQAIDLLRELNLEGVFPHYMVFNSVLFACSHRGMLQDGHQHFMIMCEDLGVIPNFSHFLCMIDLLGRAGELEAAEELVESMPFEADCFAWTILLSACKSHSDLERGALVAQKLLQLDPQQASSAYVMLSTMMYVRN